MRLGRVVEVVVEDAGWVLVRRELMEDVSRGTVGCLYFLGRCVEYGFWGLRVGVGSLVRRLWFFRRGRLYLLFGCGKLGGLSILSGLF